MLALPMRSAPFIGMTLPFAILTLIAIWLTIILFRCGCQERRSVDEFDLFIGDMTPLDVPGRHVERGPPSGLFEVFEICAGFRGGGGPEVPAVVR